MKQNIWGLLLITLLTSFTLLLDYLKLGHSIGLSALTMAIIIGMVVGNTLYPKITEPCHRGVLLAKGPFLRLGIILYGFRITLQQIDQVGVNAVASDAIMLTSTFFLTFYLGYRYLKIDKQTVLLTAAGCSICGAAAVMATEPVVKAPAHKVAVAVAIVVIFGTIAMFTYPIFYGWLHHYLSDFQFGIYIGSSVHEVAQVVAAGHALSSTVADTAVISKMIRVMMLAPFLFILSYALQDKSDKQKISIPWFAVWFIVATAIHSTGVIPKAVVSILVQLDNILLIMAMVALGLTTHMAALKQAGIKPFILGSFIFVWLVVGGFAVNLALAYLFT